MGDTAEKGPSRSRTDEAPIKTTEAQRQSSKVVFAVAAYATCSASMLIVNKLCITYLPAPTMVLFLQLSFTALAIRAMTHAGIVDADPLDVEKAKPFVLVALAFLGALYTNVKTLQYANVETFIVFRCSTPCLIAVLDYVFLGRAMPNLKSWASLGAIVCGAVTYVSFDSDFEVRAYGWVLAWYVVFAFDQIYIKYAVDQSSLSVWGRTYYMNALAVVPVSVLGLVTGESAAVSRGGTDAGGRVVRVGVRRVLRVDRVVRRGGGHELQRHAAQGDDQRDVVHGGRDHVQDRDGGDQLLDMGQTRVVRGARGAVHMPVCRTRL